MLPLTEMLTQVETYPLAFKFRYFQDFTGTLTVPDWHEAGPDRGDGGDIRKGRQAGSEDLQLDARGGLR